MASNDVQRLEERVNALEAHRDAQAREIKELEGSILLNTKLIRDLKDTFDNGAPEPACV